MKRFPWYCGTCRKKTVIMQYVTDYELTLHYGDRNPVYVTLDGFNCPQCMNCKTIVAVDTFCNMISDKIREVFNIIRPEQVYMLRGSRTIEEFADFLGIHPAELTRIENGGQIPEPDLNDKLKRTVKVLEFNESHSWITLPDWSKVWKILSK